MLITPPYARYSLLRKENGTQKYKEMGQGFFIKSIYGGSKFKKLQNMECLSQDTEHRSWIFKDRTKRKVMTP
jgi:hypothetical protein